MASGAFSFPSPLFPGWQWTQRWSSQTSQVTTEEELGLSISKGPCNVQSLPDSEEISIFQFLLWLPQCAISELTSFKEFSQHVLFWGGGRGSGHVHTNVDKCEKCSLHYILLFTLHCLYQPCSKSSMSAAAVPCHHLYWIPSATVLLYYMGAIGPARPPLVPICRDKVD